VGLSLADNHVLAIEADRKTDEAIARVQKSGDLADKIQMGSDVGPDRDRWQAPRRPRGIRRRNQHRTNLHRSADLEGGKWFWAMKYPKSGKHWLPKSGWALTAADAARLVEEIWDRQKGRSR
jgi:O-methyltransferase involved in polyketide biosynthesis